MLTRLKLGLSAILAIMLVGSSASIVTADQSKPSVNICS